MDRIRAALSDAAAAYPIPGFVAALVRNGEVVHESAHGMRDPASGAAMTPDAVFRLYSMTKAITSAAALQLVERGLLALDTPASTYAPELGAVRVIDGFDADGAPRMRAPRTPITLRHLLTHTAGFGYTFWNEKLTHWNAWAEKTGAPPANPMLDLPLVADPGAQWEYGIGIDWTGAIIERVTGQTLEAYLRENVFAPLGMEETRFHPTPAMAARLVELHTRGADGALAHFPLPPPGPPAFFSGGGGLFGTARDYLRFLAAIAAGGGPILKQDTAALFMRVEDATPRVRKLPTFNAWLSNPLDIWGAQDMRWSLGFMVNQARGPNGRSAGSQAWAGLYNTYFWIDPAERLAGVLMTQTLPFGDANVLEVFAALERAAYKHAV